MATTPGDLGDGQKAGYFERHAASVTEVLQPAERVFIYDFPLRSWHWLNAACIVVLCVTGYLIGVPPPSMPGEASFGYSFGWIRLIHFAAGQIMTIALFFRVIWAFIGSHHAQEIFLPPLWSRRWWSEVWHEIRWYAFVERTPKTYFGHNPLAQLSIFLLCMLPMFHQVLTGFALYAEGMGTDSAWFTAFGWVFSIYGDSMFVHTMHRLVMWVIVIFCLVHMYVAIREDILSRQSIISTMVSGYRYFDHPEDNHPAERAESRREER